MRAVYIFTCSMFMLQLTTTLTANEHTKYRNIVNKARRNVPKQINTQSTAMGLTTNQATTMNTIKYYFVMSAVPLNGPMSKY